MDKGRSLVFEDLEQADLIVRLKHLKAQTHAQNKLCFGADPEITSTANKAFYEFIVENDLDQNLLRELDIPIKDEDQD